MNRYRMAWPQLSPARVKLLADPGHSPTNSTATPPAALADRPRALPVVEGEPLEAKIVGYQSHKKVCRRPAGEKEEAHPDASSRHIADIVDAFAE